MVIFLRYFFCDVFHWEWNFFFAKEKVSCYKEPSGRASAFRVSLWYWNWGLRCGFMLLEVLEGKDDVLVFGLRTGKRWSFGGIEESIDALFSLWFLSFRSVGN
jgi:hypothetical protein